MRRTPPRAYSVADDSTDADLFDDILLSVDLEVDVVRVAAAMLDQGALRAESVDTDQRRRVGGHPAPPRPGRR